MSDLAKGFPVWGLWEEHQETWFCPEWLQAISLPGCTASSISCAGDPLLPRPSPAPLGHIALDTSDSTISFQRALHHREHRGNFPSHSSAVFLFCSFSNYREHLSDTGYLLLSTPLSPSGFAAFAVCSPAVVTVTLCSACSWHPLEGNKRVAQGSRQILVSQVSVLILRKVESLCILTPLLHHIPWFWCKFFCNLYYCESRVTMLLQGNSFSFNKA